MAIREFYMQFLVTAFWLTRYVHSEKEGVLVKITELAAEVSRRVEAKKLVPKTENLTVS